MKKIKFLSDMCKDGKLTLIEPSNEMKESYIKKSKSALESARILIKFGKIEESISLSYYSMYNSLLAMLYLCGIKSENHSASIIMLKEVLNEPALFEIISFGKKERIDKQYYVDFKISEEDALDMVKKAEEFANKARVVINNMTNEKIGKIRELLKESLG